MALSNYDELIDAIDRWTFERGDLNNLFPDFITLAEQEMYANPDEALEIRGIEKVSTAPTDGTRYLGLPDGYLEQRAFSINNNIDIPLHYVTPNSMIVYNGTGTPNRFTVTNQIEFNIVPDKQYTITMSYFAKPLALTSTNQTNEILTADPSIYLYGALHQANLYSEDDNEAAKFYSKFISAIKGANKRAKAGRYGVAPSIKVNGPTP